MNPPPQTPSTNLHQYQGFALVVALALLAFIFLLMVSFSSLVSLELSSKNQQRAHAQAETNALLAVSLALGELQKYAGHDQRVTARADIKDSNAAYWTGVWSTEVNTNETTTQADIKNRGPIKWLVSEPNNGELTLPTDFANKETDSDSILIFDTGLTPSPESTIVLNKQPILGGSNELKGYYAYWVSDEGIKASIALPTTGATNRANNMDARNPRRMALDAISNFSGLIKVEDDQSAYENKIERLGLSINLTNIAQALDTDETLIKEHFHDLTTVARGVASNVRDGGLKKDLTATFSAGTSLNDLITFHGDDQIFPPMGASATRMDPGGPKWAQLQSFFELRPETDSSGEKVIFSRPQKDDEMGVYPIISHFSFHQHLIIYQESAGSTSYVPRLCVLPIVVLWNPYDTRIAPETYYLKLTDNNTIDNREAMTQDISPRFYLEQDDGDPETQSWTNQNGKEVSFYRQTDVFENTNEPYYFQINSPGIMPGEALIFSAGEIEALPDNPQLPVTLVVGMNEGYYFYRDGSGRFNIDLSNPLFKIDEFALYLKSANFLRIRLATGDIANLEDENLLQHVSGTNYFIVGSGGSSGKATTRWPGTNQQLLPAESDDLTEPLIAGHPALGTNPVFPGAGAYMHLKMVNNYAEVNSNDRLPKDKRSIIPYIKPIANANPRAPRSGKGPIEQTHGPWDMIFNPSYFGNVEIYSNGLPANHSYYTFNPGSTSVNLGYSDDPSNLYGSGWVLFDIPKDESYFLSIADFAQANLSQPFLNSSAFLKNPAKTFNIQNTWPAYAIGNSLQDPRIPANKIAQDEWPVGTQTVNTEGYYHYDISYLLNDALWDPYFLSAYDTNTEESLNVRYLVNQDFTFDFNKSASALLVNGVFNVNSTSVDAWKAILSSALGVKINYQGGTFTSQTDVPLLRIATAWNSPAPEERNSESDQVYNGFLTLNESDIDALAKAIVTQVRERGPFVSLAHFINRVLADDNFQSANEKAYASSDDAGKHAMMTGVLQAAIDASAINEASPDKTADRFNDAKYEIPKDELSEIYVNMDVDASLGDRAAGNPGYLTQADLLKYIGPVISVRSDTFTIRAYGEAVNQLTGQPSASAICSVTVQRVPDFVDKNSGDLPEAALNSISPTNQRLGRAFRIVDFKWLNSDSI